MVSCARELFRRGGREETFGAEMRMISMRLKSEGFRCENVPLSLQPYLAPQRAGEGAADSTAQLLSPVGENR
jgi:hypothetical protein